MYGALSCLPQPIPNMFQSLGGPECANRARLISISMLAPLKICSMSEFVSSWRGNQSLESRCLTVCCLEPTASSHLGFAVLEIVL